MVWMLLTPREAELVKTNVATSEGPNAILLRHLQTKLVTRGSETELALTEEEWRKVQAAAANWKAGHERAFKAIIEAGLRHGN